LLEALCARIFSSRFVNIGFVSDIFFCVCVCVQGSVSSGIHELTKFKSSYAKGLFLVGLFSTQKGDLRVYGSCES